MNTIKRRDVLKFSATSLSLLSFPSLAIQNKIPPSIKDKKLVWILLRGGMDGLQATMPLFDPELIKLRSDLVLPEKNSALKLNRGFALHPELKFMHKLYKKNQLNAIIATSTPYRERSHFAAQDFLESGLYKTDVDDGWLARALTELNTKSQKNNDGLAISRSVPISLRGNSNVMTWYPSTLPSASNDFYHRLSMLYEKDVELSMKLKQGIETQNLTSSINRKRQRGKFPDLAQSCAKLLNSSNGPSIAMLEMEGWDTHNRQVNRLRKKFKELDKGIKALHKGLEKKWSDTTFIITTEFGRTVKINGTGGTDHGTGTSMFIGGGAVNGGDVLGEWPGLLKENLYEGRDLKPTSNTFNWIANALKEHWQLSETQISQIFPKS